MSLLDRAEIRVGEVRLRVTQIGKPCHEGCAIREMVGDCIMPRVGVFAAVVAGGSSAAHESDA
ncbi:hypothetical protein J7K76_05050 [Candidatus Bipolaricaulota bacterium]|nr:hypothetical protein [Candidatus Bipolaricaulota bacterium]